jgi:hypothetical protein
MRVLMLAGWMAWVAYGAVAHVPIKNGVELKAGEAWVLNMDASGQVEIGWEAVQPKRCVSDCVRFTYLPTNLVFAAAQGGLGRYTPVAGKVSVEYKNVGTDPVTLNIYRLRRTCDAEACQFLAKGEKGRALTFKVEEFKSITTSKDESCSVITGVTTLGRPFRVRVVWWTDDKVGRFRCAQFIQRYLTNHTPKEQYRPYILDGEAVDEGNNIVLRRVDTCVPKAPNFVALNDFK